MDKIHVIFISSVRPEPTSAGQIILYRHFCNRPEFDLEVHGFEPKKFSARMVIRRVLGRFARLGGFFETIANCAWVVWEGYWIDPDLPSQVDCRQKTIVGTLAHGDGFYAAQRFAKKHGLPLVVFFQDWWPDMAGVPKPLIRLLDKKFMDLAKSCSLGICVCAGMKKALGGGENLQVLPPIPAENLLTQASNLELSNREKFKVVYSGNLDLYGGMLLDALRVLKDHPTIHFQVRGSNPNWPEEAKKELREAGLWLEFAPRFELEAWLQSADAFLIPMVFEEKYRRRMETSFPSKLIEFAQFGKPLIIWGPEYCSGVNWAIQNKAALIVINKSSVALKNKIEQFFISAKKENFFLGKAIKSKKIISESNFIQKQFISFFSFTNNQ